MAKTPAMAGPTNIMVRQERSLYPTKYTDLLKKKLQEHKTPVYLINTGGGYGVGKRMKLPCTRQCVGALLDGNMTEASFVKDPLFGLEIPTTVKGVPSAILNPRDAWSDKAAFDPTAHSSWRNRSRRISSSLLYPRRTCESLPQEKRTPKAKDYDDSRKSGKNSSILVSRDIEDVGATVDYERGPIDGKTLQTRLRRKDNIYMIGKYLCNNEVTSQASVDGRFSINKMKNWLPWRQTAKHELADARIIQKRTY
ncbi:hypothetical protein PsorP6_000796 [Peronosclerospora sorghi]|uniref:Uncharacterized protein n=1 Tax=Peronosclerospora sorghi TaxID=230839 RepID=A0ACC0WPP8_9STRA|nr:hypothetical protein PsorP6_000796 [Peronosclerospora sorghi]